MSDQATRAADGPAAMLSEAQRALLGAVLDALLPPRDGLGGAGALGVAASIEQGMAERPLLRRLVGEAMAAIAVAAGTDDGTAFAALNPDLQEAALAAAEEAVPLPFALLLDYAYRGYYTLPAVLAAIGYDGRPPQPLGRELPVFDPALLERQRTRAPFWRRT